MIPINAPLLGPEEEELVLEVLRSGRLVQGPMVERFEAAVREVTGTAHAVAVDNGTNALMLALAALDVGPGDEVVVPAFTFVATLNAVLHAGATPRFVDVSDDDMCLDADAASAAIGPRTKAVMPVHLFGLPADMEALERAIGGRAVAIVEDAAQALGAAVGDRPVGSFGQGCFSFYATKNVTTGEGGAITTDDEALAGRLRILRNQGQRGRYDYAEPGFNVRMTELAAAVGVAQMTRFEGIVKARRANAEALTDGLGGLAGVVVPSVPPGREHVWHQYTIRVTDGARLGRDEAVAAIRAAGVDAGVYYPRPVYDYPCFRAESRVGPVRLPGAERLAAEVCSLPVHPAMTGADVDAVIAAVRGALG